MVEIPLVSKIELDKDGQYIIKVPSDLPLLDYFSKLNNVSIYLHDDDGNMEDPDYVNETKLLIQEHYGDINENIDEIMQDIESKRIKQRAKKARSEKHEEIKDLNLPIETKLNPFAQDDTGLDLEQFDFQKFIMDDDYAEKVLDNPANFDIQESLEKNLLENPNEPDTTGETKTTMKKKSTKKTTKAKATETKAAKKTTKKKSSKKTTKAKATETKTAKKTTKKTKAN